MPFMHNLVQKSYWTAIFCRGYGAPKGTAFLALASGPKTASDSPGSCMRFVVTNPVRFVSFLRGLFSPDRRGPSQISRPEGSGVERSLCADIRTRWAVEFLADKRREI